MKRLPCIIVITVMALMAAGIVYAQFAKPDDALRYRQAVMTVIGQHFGRMAAVVKGKQPYDAAEFENNAAVVAMLSKLPWEAVLYPDSDQGKTTLLLSKALKDRDGFMKHAQTFEKSAGELAAIAKKGNLEAVKIQFGAVGQACGGCHKEYRSK